MPSGEPPVSSTDVPADDLGATLPSSFSAEGETFQHYTVLRRPDGRLWELGRGAMGITYKAFDTNLRCHVALKVISANYIHSETAGQRFIREARIAARVRHPNIATVYHLGTDPQGFFYAMEFIEGETLEDLVDRLGPLPVETVLRIGLQAARALTAASRQGLIHRDIKPANLMVIHQEEESEDRLFVKMIDFGLARSYTGDDSNPQLTSTGFVGTPLYASPEQLEERDLDVRSDIYSLGVTLWILLTGQAPFQGKMTQVITQHLNAPPPWWQLSETHGPMRGLLERMLQKNRAERFQTASDLRAAIEACLREVTGKEVANSEPADPVPVITRPMATPARRVNPAPAANAVHWRPAEILTSWLRPTTPAPVQGGIGAILAWWTLRLRVPLVVFAVLLLGLCMLAFFRGKPGRGMQTNLSAAAAPKTLPRVAANALHSETDQAPTPHPGH